MLIASGCKGGQPPHTPEVDSLASSINKLEAASHPALKSGHKYGLPTGKVRVANLLEIDGKPAGPLDFYEYRRPDSSDAPIIKHLEYGKISGYVSPRADSPNPGAKSFLFVFPADQKTSVRPFGGVIDQSGWEAGDRMSIALGPAQDAGSGASIAVVAIAEGGRRVNSDQADSAKKIQSAEGLLVVRAANSHVDALPELYFMIDGKCPHAPNDMTASGDTAKYRTMPSSVSATLFFPLAPGTHTLGVVTSKRGSGLSNCNGLAPVGTTASVNVEAGRRYMVWVFGQSSDGFKVVAAPVATQ
ncbi:MAG: hypothetical protein ABI884_10485 [Gemmatimonadota bacterium]